jgi:lysophospholipase L1-like esterase
MALTASFSILLCTTQKSLHAQDATSNLWSKPELPAAHQATLLQPFWIGNRMSNEPILFLKEPNQPYATARLLFIPTKLLSISSVNGAIEFIEGQDYSWKHGSNLLTLTKDSRIPFKTVAEMHPPIGAPNTLGKTKDGKSSLFFIGNGPDFQNMQPLATYEHQQKWAGHIPQSGKTELGRTIAKLSTKQPVNIVVLGDSISTGASASSMFNEFPYQPGYPDIIADGLRFRYGASISLTNLSEGGQDSKWAISQVAKVVAAKPDLVILGFGMNDASRRFTDKEYAKNIQTVVSTVRAALPETDFILVSTMVGNPDWEEAVPELYSQYRNVLTRMQEPGISVADLTTVWLEMLRIKKFADITANGINHPNDFGQRTYAHVILQLMQ